MVTWGYLVFRQFAGQLVVVGLGSLGSFIPFPAEYGAEGVPRLPDAVPTLVVWLGIWLDVIGLSWLVFALD